MCPFCAAAMLLAGAASAGGLASLAKKGRAKKAGPAAPEMRRPPEKGAGD
jgi:hypothetical protein